MERLLYLWFFAWMAVNAVIFFGWPVKRGRDVLSHIAALVVGFAVVATIVEVIKKYL